MIVMFGVLDRFLDIIGLIALVWWTIKAVRWWYRRKHVDDSVNENRNSILEEAAVRLDREWPGPASEVVRSLKK